MCIIHSLVIDELLTVCAKIAAISQFAYLYVTRATALCACICIFIVVRYNTGRENYIYMYIIRVWKMNGRSRESAQLTRTCLYLYDCTALTWCARTSEIVYGFLKSDRYARRIIIALCAAKQCLNRSCIPFIRSMQTLYKHKHTRIYLQFLLLLLLLYRYTTADNM